ncbi:hypothetical protein CRUP_035584 [Coryphaenoides rupestris]|nr:hypothetical protein CRUP_035584 [Coryphaenoides rupestris]
MLQELSDWVWQERLWLPEGLGWADLQDRDGRVYAKGKDLWATLPIALAFLLVRQIFERTVAMPLASLLGVKETVRLPASPNPTLEAFYCNTSKNPSQSSVESLCKQTGCSERQVQRWFRRRRNQDRPGKPWLYDLKQLWEGFPIVTLLPSQYWYYMLELGFYIALLFSVASDVKRKIVHHLAAIFLLSFSWCANYIRTGTLVMLLHDSSDYFLESAKMFNYAGWRKTCNCIFILFAVVFIITRLDLTLYVGLHDPFFGYYFLNSLMFVLQLLHIFWAILIIRMAVRLMTTNNDKVHDERSDREETDESEEEEDGKKDTKKNGVVTNGHMASNNNHHCKAE